MAFWKILDSEKEEDDLVDAFVAMGGNPDKTGTIDAKSLIRTVKNEFEMTIDIEVKLKKRFFLLLILSFFKKETHNGNRWR